MYYRVALRYSWAPIRRFFKGLVYMAQCRSSAFWWRWSVRRNRCFI